MVVGGLDYSIRKKLNIQYLRDMSQLADRVRQVGCLKAEKARDNKNSRRERVVYVEMNEEEPKVYTDPIGFDKNKIDLA